MNWSLEEAITHYRAMGTDQNTLVNLLKEIQQEQGGSIPLFAVPQVAENFGVKESFLLALIRRIPSLRLGDTHELLICSGPNCGKQCGTEYAECFERCMLSQRVNTYRMLPEGR